MRALSGGRGAFSAIAVIAAVTLGVTACSASTTGPSDASSPAAGSSEAPQAAIDVLNILPPGNATGPSQRAMYDALNTIDPATLTDAKLSTYYKSAALDPAPGTVVKTETPEPGVTIERDKYGVPFVYGKTDDETAYGAGYAGTEDRMFVMDALRYAGAARVSELLGPTKANLAMDASQLRQADYTPAEADAQIDAVARSGPVGKDLASRVDAFVAGVNAARQKLCPTVSAATCPSTYKLLGVTPTPYTRADVVYAGSLVGGIFGKGGGNEAANGLFLRKLQQSVGDAVAAKEFKDLRDAQDPTTPVTVPGEQPYGAPDSVDQAAIALPDIPSSTVKIAPGTGGLPANAATSGSGAGGGETLADRLQVPSQMSNAMLVAANHTTTGHPIAVMGPQTAYQAPNFFDEIALHGPHYQARGVAFANLQFAVLIGHGRSYAWSATSSSGDVVDIVFDRLCNKDGSKATVNSTAYLDGSSCVAMTGEPHVLRSQSGKVIATLPDMRTRHGIVQYRTTSGGTPVAVVSERSTYGHEPDSILGFAEMNDPAKIKSAHDFIDAFSKVTFTFNWFYADTRDIATFTSGLLPIRAKGVDPDLPRWGDRKWDWTGFLSAAAPSAGHQPAVGLPGQLEQQAVSRHVFSGRPVGLGPGPTGARPAGSARGLDEGGKDQPVHPDRRHDRRSNGRRARRVPAEDHAGCGRQRPEVEAVHRSASGMAQHRCASRRQGADRSLHRSGGDRPDGHLVPTAGQRGAHAAAREPGRQHPGESGQHPGQRSGVGLGQRRVLPVGLA